MFNAFILRTVMFGVAVGIVVLPADKSRSAAAIDHFWTVYHGNDYASIPDVQVELQSAIAGDRDNPTLYALLGATHFWHISEYTRASNPDLAVLQQDMPTAAGLFQQAMTLDYDGQHLPGYENNDALPGFLGVTTVHAGKMTSNPPLIAAGDHWLDYAVYQFPEFNNFNRWAQRPAARRPESRLRLLPRDSRRALGCAGLFLENDLAAAGFGKAISQQLPRWWQIGVKMTF
jgi:hypothetical protein